MAGVEAVGQRGQDVGVAPDAGRGRFGLGAADHAAFQVGGGAVFLGPLGDRQHHIGEGSGFGQEDVRHHQQLQALQALGQAPGVGGGDGDVGGHHQQAMDRAVLAHGAQQGAGGQAGLGQAVGVDAPYGGHRGAVGGVGELAVARELVGFLAVLAAALAVALAGQAAPAAVGTAGQAQSEGQIDEGLGVVDTVALLLGAAGGEDHGAGGVAEQVRGLGQQRGGDAGDALDPIGPVGGGDAAGLLEAGGAGGDVVSVDQAVAGGDMEQAEGERGVGAGGELQVQVGCLDRRGAAGVGHDQLAAAGALGVEILHDRRHGLGGIAAHDQHGAGGWDVLQRERQAAIDAEGAQAGGRRRGHAEAAIIVDVGGAKGDAGELAEQVGFFVGQAAAAEHRHGVNAVRGLDAGDGGGDMGQRLVPCGGAERGVLGGAEQRGGQAVGRVEQARGGPAFAAEAAFVGGEVAGGYGPGAIRVGQQRHAALQGAIRAVRVGHAEPLAFFCLIPVRPEGPRPTWCASGV
jgi:hypothetical protein